MIPGAVVCSDTSTRRLFRSLPTEEIGRRGSQGDGCRRETGWWRGMDSSRRSTRRHRRSTCQCLTTIHVHSRSRVSGREPHSLPARHMCRLTDDTEPCDRSPARSTTKLHVNLSHRRNWPITRISRTMDRFDQDQYGKAGGRHKLPSTWFTYLSYKTSTVDKHRHTDKPTETDTGQCNMLKCARKPTCSQL